MNPGLRGAARDITDCRNVARGMMGSEAAVFESEIVCQAKRLNQTTRTMRWLESSRFAVHRKS
jgi:hypothetical protein